MAGGGAGEAQAVGMPHLGRELRRGDEGLARHAPGPQAVAAERVPLDERHLESQGRRAGSRHQSGGPAAYGYEIESLHRVP